MNQVFMYVQPAQFKYKNVEKKKLTRRRKLIGVERARFAPSRAIIVRVLFDTGKPCETTNVTLLLCYIRYFSYKLCHNYCTKQKNKK